MNFIKQCINSIRAQELDTRNLILIVPSQRVGYLVRKLWAQLTSKAEVMPLIFTPDQWVTHYTMASVITRVEWIHHCYKVMYQMNDDMGKPLVNERFLEFFPLGRVLSYDFEELLLYNINMHHVYQLLRQKAEIDTRFADFLTPEQVEHLQHFFESVSNNRHKQTQARFASLYEAMPKIFKAVEERLSHEGKVTLGMAYHQLAQRFAADPSWLSYKHIFWLAPTHFYPVMLPMIRDLISQKVLHIFWYQPAFGPQSPVYFLNSPLLPYLKDPVFQSTLSNQPQTDITEPAITEFAANGHMGQAAITAQILHRLATEYTPSQMQLVVPEQKLLTAIREQIPDDIQSTSALNFNFTESILHDWLRTILLMAEHLEANGSQILLPLHILQTCIQHPAFASNPAVQRWQDTHQHTIQQLLNKPDWPIEVSSMDTLMQQLIPLLLPVFNIARIQDLVFYFQDNLAPYLPASHRIQELHMCTAALNTLNQLQAIIGDETFTAVELRQHIGQLFFDTSIHTEGSFDGMLQVGGLAATHAIEHDYLIVTGLNYGSLPAQAAQRSYIPINIRKMYGLPVPDDLIQREAFYFYNALYTARHVYLLYSAGGSSINKHEHSPFYLQLKYLTTSGSKARKAHIIQTASEQPVQPITIAKDAQVMDEINRFFSSIQAKYVSQSLLTTYLSCRLKFYFEYIKKLRKEKHFFEPIEPNELGTVFHKAIELLYSPYLNTTITDDTLSKIHSHIKEAVAEAMSLVLLKTESLNDHTHKPEGNSYLNSGLMQIYAVIIESWIHNTLKMDKKRLPFRLVGLEKSDLRYPLLLKNGMQINLGGIIDRLELHEASNKLVVVDFKTGSPSNIKLTQTDLETLFKNSADLKYLFQAHIYLLLASRLSKDLNVQDVEALFLPVRAPESKLEKYTVNSTTSISSTPTNQNAAGSALELEKRLTDCIEEIIDPAIPFSQTDDLKICQYCDMNVICRKV